MPGVRSLMEDASPYNPLSKGNLAASIVTKLLHQEAQKFPLANFPVRGFT
jgi:hypothetical protein